MKRIQAFFVTFVITFCVMLCMFAGLYWFVSSDVRAAETKQEKVPKTEVQPEDSKTTLCVLESGGQQFFFLIKLNAIQNKVSVVSIPSYFYLDKAERTLGESMDYAGVRQCVQDLSEQFDLKISYHMVCNTVLASKIMGSFTELELGGISIPEKAAEYLKGDRADINSIVGAVELAAAGLNNPEGIEFLNISLYSLIKNNMVNLKEYVPDEIKGNFSQLNTNLGTQELDKLEKIAGYLCNENVEYSRLVVNEGENAQIQLDRELNQ